MRAIARCITAFPLTIVILSCLCLASCTSYQGGGSGQNVIIDWVSFVRFGGVTYLEASPGRPLKEGDLGPVFATVKFKLDGHISDPGYQARDGDAAFLDAGTQVYTVKGYQPTFRLAAHGNNSILLFEADTNPHAKKGADLLDIAGKVQYIGINSEQDGTTELAAIRDPKQVAILVSIVLEAPVDQNYRSSGNTRYFIAFHLLDGTGVTRAYWPDSGELSRGILLPKAFGNMIEQALRK